MIIVGSAIAVLKKERSHFLIIILGKTLAFHQKPGFSESFCIPTEIVVKKPGFSALSGENIALALFSDHCIQSDRVSHEQILIPKTYGK